MNLKPILDILEEWANALEGPCGAGSHVRIGAAPKPDMNRG